MSETPLICHRCGIELTPGEGQLYVVRIEALADPFGPNLTEEDLARDHKAEIDHLLEAMSGLSEQEAMDQIYRKLSLCLCNACFRKWIENPTGEVEDWRDER